GQHMYRITRTSTICVTIAAATVALVLLTSTILTASVYATRYHHGHKSIEDMPTNIGGYRTYGLGRPPLSDQVNAPPVSDQNNGNGNNPVGNQVNAPPVSKEQIQTHAPTTTYKSPSSNDMLMSFTNITQPLCAAGICSQSYTNH
ncbi:MAG: hypothetical protein WA323_05320, partial [Candidatus Nitrosopolaris sp.]